MQKHAYGLSIGTVKNWLGTGKTASTLLESKSQSGTAQMKQALKKAGRFQPPGLDLGLFPKRTDARDKKAIDYRQEAFPPPTLRIVQPGGRQLKEAPLKPREGWVAETCHPG